MILVLQRSYAERMKESFTDCSLLSSVFSMLGPEDSDRLYTCHSVLHIL